LQVYCRLPEFAGSLAAAKNMGIHLTHASEHQWYRRRRLCSCPRAMAVMRETWGVENRRRTLSEPQRRPVFERSGGQSGSILPAASCNPSNPPFGL